MYKNTSLFLFILFFFSVSRVVFASPIINEIMYDLDGPDIDWVEIYNPDSADVDLTALKLLISNSTSNHGIVKNSGSQVLHQGDYGVIVVTSQASSFLSKWSSVANVFTSSFSLPNDTAKVEINDGDKNVPISSVTYISTQGATEDGNSLQLISGSWAASVPTPGAVNAVAPSDPNDSDDTNTNSSSGSSIVSGDVLSSSPTPSSSSSTKVVQSPKIKVKIIGKAFTFTGIPFPLQAEALGYSNEKLFSGKYYWNFGDGDSLEARDSRSFFHTYMYPGEYPVTLEFSSNYYSDVPEAVAKLTIKVVPMTIGISRVGEANDFFIELSNNTGYEIDVSKWILSAGNSTLSKKFILPKGTVILAKKNMIISPKISNFSIEDKNTLKLSTEDGKIVFDYGASIVPAQPVLESVAPVEPVEEKKITLTVTKTEKPIEQEQVIDLSQVETIPAITETAPENLSAAAIESGAVSEEVNSNHFYPMIFSVAFIGASAGAVYFIRRRKVAPSPGGDFEILDE